MEAFLYTLFIIGFILATSIFLIGLLTDKVKLMEVALKIIIVTLVIAVIGCLTYGGKSQPYNNYRHQHHCHHCECDR